MNWVFYKMFMILVPEFSEKQVVFNDVYIFKFTWVFGVQKRPKTPNFGSKSIPPLVKKKKLNITVMWVFTRFSKSWYQNFYKSK